MTWLHLLLSFLFSTDYLVLFKFDRDADIRDWKVIDDVVMGGRSQGTFAINAMGNGVFQGSISLENNGGFSSLRYRFPKINIEKFSTLVLKVKGDKKIYQVRAKSSRFDRHSYIATFETTDQWQIIEVPLADMHPKFRGRALNMPNYPAEEMEELALLISNKLTEDFVLEIAEIQLR